MLPETAIAALKSGQPLVAESFQVCLRICGGRGCESVGCGVKLFCLCLHPYSYSYLLYLCLCISLTRQSAIKKIKFLVSESAQEVSILFTDIVGFTEISAQITPFQLLRLLNEIYSMFDKLVDRYNLYKVEVR
jgi:hypothetical protein